MLLRLDKLTKTYRRGARERRVLDDLDLLVEPAEFLAITGPSGSGKTTLLRLLGGLDRPSAGRIYYDDADLARCSDRQLAEFRRRQVGFVFQDDHLLPALTAVENVALPLLLDGVAPRRAAQRAVALLDELGLAEQRDQIPGELSGGERQRVAIARALVIEPLVLLADEPTGNLDQSTGRALLDRLTAAVAERDLTVVLATHDPVAVTVASRERSLRDGRWSSVS